jgi:hypothetical protein
LIRAADLAKACWIGSAVAVMVATRLAAEGEGMGYCEYGKVEEDGDYQ